MSTETEMLQRVRREYRSRTGETELDHRKVADFAIKKLGWRVPKPPDPVDILAKKLSNAARVEERVDTTTTLPYRANLSYSVMRGQEQLTLWVDVDEATRPQIKRCATKFRDQIAGEVFRLANTLDHWSRTHPNEEPVQVPLDFGPDVEWMRNAPREDERAS